jgi:hypothetical protein
LTRAPPPPGGATSSGSCWSRDAWDALVEQHGYALLEAWLRAAIEAGEVDPLPVPALVRLLGAVLAEASLVIARAADPAAARRDVGVAVDTVLRGVQRQQAAAENPVSP